MTRHLLSALYVLTLLLHAGLAQPAETRATVAADVGERVSDLESLTVQARRINDFVYKIDGQGALFLVNTSAGAVLIDTGNGGEQSARQKTLVEELASGPIVKIIATHAHSDHVAGLPAWRQEIEAGTELVAHQRYGYMARLQREAMPRLKQRFHVLYPRLVDLADKSYEQYWSIEPTRLVYPGSDYRFELGGVRFEVIAPENTGEGEDGLLVWLPGQGILFTGDMFGPLYPMFPNLYTVRGEKMRDALDYVAALDQILALEPHLLLPSHFGVIEGRDTIRASVTRMRDAVQYVWDQTLTGMNAGKSLWQVMDEVQLPEQLRVSEGHGKVSWGVRAIWETVLGWYDYDTVANLYAVPPSAVHADLLELAGGAGPVAVRARRHLDAGRPLEALRLLDVARDSANRMVLETRIATLEDLLRRARAGARNHSEIGLLEADLRATGQALDELGSSSS